MKISTVINNRKFNFMQSTIYTIHVGGNHGEYWWYVYRGKVEIAFDLAASPELALEAAQAAISVAFEQDFVKQ